jgi:lysine 2,3-aminomutase
VVLRNFEGVITTYAEPRNYDSECSCDTKDEKYVGVVGLLKGQKITIEPSDLERNRRKFKKA